MPRAVPSFPSLPAYEAVRQDWVRYLNRVHSIWGAQTIRAYGAYESVVTQRGITADCIDSLRHAGTIK